GFWEKDQSLRDALVSLAASPDVEGSRFNMTVLAIRGSNRINAVSQAHRNVTSQMFTPLFGHADFVESVTNGVHIPTWVAPGIDALFEHYIGPDWKEHHDDASLWDRVFDIPDEELWQVRQLLKTHLLTFIRDQARERWIRNKTTTAAQLAASGSLL